MNVDKIKGGLGFHILKFKNIDLLVEQPKQYNTTEVTSGWKEYKKAVWMVTHGVCHQIPGIEKRGFKDHHIDHIVSIWRGYKFGVSPEDIGGLGNLRMLPYKENMRKGRN